MPTYQHIVETKEENFKLRPWGGYMCFLATPEQVNCKKFLEAAVLHMKHGLCHEGHVHDDCDEILCVLKGIGCHTFWDAEGNETSYEIHPGDILYVAKNRMHRTQNLSTEEDLELFITNCRIEEQSDPNVSGMIPFKDGAEKSTEYGAVTKAIYETVCGNQVITGDFLTLNPAAKLASEAVTGEELIFVLEGQAEISYSGNEASQVFSTHTLGFFHKGETYTITNTSSAPVRLYRLSMQ